MTGSLLTRLLRRDRVWYHRLRLRPGVSHGALRFWRTITHLGGASATIAACLMGMLLPQARWAALHAAVALILALVISQVMKRSVSRARPRGVTVVDAPDRFSFPSGHSMAAMAVAAMYALTWPALGVWLVPIAMLVGYSRVALGVHYPLDVIVGQAIGLGIAILLRLW
jgi:undecaprenyl-diphosphatase